MAREEKVWEYVANAGFTPLEDRCIIVKGAAGDLSEKIVRFFETWDVAVLQMCENELVLLPFESFWGTLERDVSLVVPYADIESVKLIDACSTWSSTSRHAPAAYASPPSKRG